MPCVETITGTPPLGTKSAGVVVPDGLILFTGPLVGTLLLMGVVSDPLLCKTTGDTAPTGTLWSPRISIG
jgi:hypothetical protein